MNAILTVETLTTHGDWQNHAFRGPWLTPGRGGSYRVIGVRVPAPEQAGDASDWSGDAVDCELRRDMR
jgi:hypothetical protein